MRKMTAALVLLLGLNVFFCQGQEKSLSSLMLQNESDTPRKQLKDILRQIQDVYKVNLLFETKVEGLTTSYQVNPAKDINHALKELLAPFQLTYVRLNNKNYIIKSVQAASGSTSTSLVVQEALAVADSSEPRSVSVEKTGAQSVDPPTEVKGFVVDENGKPIVGATVLIKGTNIGCQTDNTGGFAIKIPEANKPVLMVSFIGMKYQEVNVKNKTSIRVFMEKSDRQNEDIVVVGYGRQAKKDVVTAVSTIKAEEIMQENTVNLGNALQGKVNGAVIVSRSGQPGSNRPLIMIRGNNPKYSPLIVIDGVPRYQDQGNNAASSGALILNGITLDDINPDEVESISVLKDNAATAIYGTRGAGGVIIIETKRGKAGKPQFNFSTNYATSAPCRFPTLLNAYEYAQVENENYMNTAAIGKPKYTDSVMNIIHYGLDPYTYGNVDLYNMIVIKPHVQQNSLSVSGGSDAVRYYVNGSYSNEGGLIAAYGYKRYTVQSNLDVRLTNDLKLAVNTGFITSTMNGTPAGSTPFSTILINSPLTPIYNKNGTLYSPGLNTNRWASVQPDLAGYQRNNNNNISVQANLQYTPSFLKGFTFRLNNNINYNAATFSALFKYYDAYRPDATSPTGYTKTSGTSGFAGPGSNNLRETIGTGISYNTDYGFDYNKKLRRHSIGITALGTHYYTTSRQNTTYRDGMINGIEAINNGRALNQQTGGFSSEDGRVGGVLRASYNFAGKYYAEYSMRADASDHFPKSKRWGYFPGGAVSWRLSEEEFIKNNLPFIQDLKIRASLGVAGIDNLDAYSYFYNYSVATTGTGGGAGYSFGGTYQPSFVLANGNVPNPDVTWGKSIMQNLGMDFNLWKGLLSGTFDIYRKDISGTQIDNASATPLTFGIGGPKANLGKEFYSGFEASLANNAKLGRDMSLQTTLNFSYARSRMVYTGEGDNVPDWQRKQGHSVGARSYYKALGLFQTQKEISDYTVKQDKTNNSTIKPGDTKYADMDNNGMLNDTDRVWYENINLPPYTWGLNITYRYKNFSLNMMFQGAGGNWVQFVPGDYTAYGRDNRWNPAHTAEQNENALYPRLAMDNQSNNSPSVRPNTLYLNKGDYIRFKNLSIGYNIPNQLIKKAGLSNLKIYAAMMNVASFSKFKDIDPEAANTDINNGGYYPVMRNYTIGLNVGF